MRKVKKCKQQFYLGLIQSAGCGKTRILVVWVNRRREKKERRAEIRVLIARGSERGRKKNRGKEREKLLYEDNVRSR